MIKSSDLFNYFKESGVEFYTGVPDSLLKHFCAYIADNTGMGEHIIAANEGGAVALASGYHLATGKVPLVYLQNSGLGNIINPLLSLADKEIYGLPVILMIGWRGKPGIKDEPQHTKQGRIQDDLLKALDIPFVILGPDTSGLGEFVDKAVRIAKDKSSPIGIVVEPGTFEKYSPKDRSENNCELTREDAIEIILGKISQDDIIVSTTGKASRELYEARERGQKGHQNDFLTVGSMGHCSQIALGIALNTSRNVLCLDGDGSILMHMGSLAVIGSGAKPKNFIHVIFNNGCHDSVGGQPTCGFDIELSRVAKVCGYGFAESVSTGKNLRRAISRALKEKGPSVIEVQIKKGSRSDLGRPRITPAENKKILMDLLRKENGK